MRQVEMARYPRLEDILYMLSLLRTSCDEAESRFILGKCLRDCYGVDLVIEVSVSGLDTGQYRIGNILIGHGLGDSAQIDFAGPAVTHGGILGMIVQTHEVKLTTGLECANDQVLGSLLVHCHSLLAIPIPSELQPDKWLVFFSTSAVGFTKSNMEQVALLGTLYDNQSELDALRRLDLATDEAKGYVGEPEASDLATIHDEGGT